MNVREINSTDELAELQPVWQELLSQTPQASFFQSLDWLQVYWKYTGADQHLRVLVIEEYGYIVGIMPLVVRREKTKVGPIRFLTYPLDYWGAFYGPIGAKPDQILAAAFDYLSISSHDSDVLELRWIEGGAEACSTIETLLETAQYSPQRSQHDATYVIDLTGSWKDYLASRTSKWRNNYRRWERKLSEVGEISYVRFRPEANADGDPRWDYYDECLRIANASWQGSSTTGTTLTHENVAAFLRETHEVAARCGCVDLNLLYIDDRAVAFAYNYVYQGYVYGMRVGFNPIFPVKGAGNLLYAKAIEDSFQRGDWRYDLGPRHPECKRALQTDELPIYRISCYKKWSVRQQLLSWKRQFDARSEVQVLPVTTQTAEVPVVNQS